MCICYASKGWLLHSTPAGDQVTTRLKYITKHGRCRKWFSSTEQTTQKLSSSTQVHPPIAFINGARASFADAWILLWQESGDIFVIFFQEKQSLQSRRRVVSFAGDRSKAFSLKRGIVRDEHAKLDGVDVPHLFVFVTDAKAPAEPEHYEANEVVITSELHEKAFGPYVALLRLHRTASSNDSVSTADAAGQVEQSCGCEGGCSSSECMCSKRAMFCVSDCTCGSNCSNRLPIGSTERAESTAVRAAAAADFSAEPSAAESNRRAEKCPRRQPSQQGQRKGWLSAASTATVQEGSADLTGQSTPTRKRRRTGSNKL